MQGTVDGFSYGLVTPVVAYLMACLGGALGLRCTTRAMLVAHSWRPGWLALGSAAIGSGIWTMHFIAMIGFTVEGAPIHYDKPTTYASLGVAILMVGVGIFIVGYKGATGTALFTGGTITGLGIASMHYLGMAGMRFNGDFEYNTFTVGASVVIAMVAATAALWAAGQVRGFLWSVGASLVMGLAVTGMHYTGMTALSVHLHSHRDADRGRLAGRPPRADADRPPRLPLPRRGRRDVRPADGHGQTRLDPRRAQARSARAPARSALLAPFPAPQPPEGGPPRVVPRPAEPLSPGPGSVADAPRPPTADRRPPTRLAAPRGTAEPRPAPPPDGGEVRESPDRAPLSVGSRTVDGMRPVSHIERTVAPFEVVSPYQPSGDQPAAIAELAKRVDAGEKDVVLLGATGTGKSATTAWMIEKLQRPTLVMAPNKTLAAQLANEFRELLPNNAVEYFVSYYDYYQPEAYVPQSDTYIEKDSSINEEVERLRHSATNSLLTRRDVVVVASVSCIYGLGTPQEYVDRMVPLKVGDELDRDELLRRFVDIQYTRNDLAFTRGTFRVRGDTIEIFPVYEELAVRIEMFGDEIEALSTLHPLTGEIISDDRAAVRLPGHPLRRGPRAHGAGRRTTSRRSWASAWPSWRSRASCWRPSGCGCAPRTTWRCSARSAPAPASRTTRCTSTAARPAPRRTPCSTTSRTTSCSSSTSRTSPSRRSAPCTRATPPASAPSSTTASGCPPPWTTAR